MEVVLTFEKVARVVGGCYVTAEKHKTDFIERFFFNNVEQLIELNKSEYLLSVKQMMSIL